MTIQAPTRKDVVELIEHQAPHCVSLFMPSHTSGPDQRQDPIRLKNLVNKAEELLVDRGENRLLVQEILKPLRDFNADQNFWKYSGKGLAVFSAKDFLRKFHLPITVDEVLSVRDRFSIRPLLPLIHGHAHFHILTLTREDVKLYRANRFEIEEIELPDIEPIEIDGPDKTLQHHTQDTPSHHAGPASNVGIYHSHGGPDEREKKDITNFFHRVNDVVAPKLKGQQAPLILSCLDYLAPLYHVANSYSRLMDEHLPHKPDRWRPDDLRREGWKLLEPHFHEEQHKAWEKFQVARNRNLATTELEEIVFAADQGRVETLFLPPDHRQKHWGQIDLEQQSIHPVDDDKAGEDLLDFAAARTLSTGGEVFIMDQQEAEEARDALMTATFRY